MTGIQRFKVMNKNNWDGPDKEPTVSQPKADVEVLNALNSWLLDEKNKNIKSLGANFGSVSGENGYCYINLLYFKEEKPVVQQEVIDPAPQ